MAEGKLQIDQRMDRIESAIMILVKDGYPQATVDKVEQTLKGKTPTPWPVAQEAVSASEEN